MTDLYCPDCGFQKHEVYRAETFDAFRCLKCDTVETWDRTTYSVQLREANK